MMDIIVSLETLAHDVRYALRSLYKSPGFTAVVILILALGIGANTAVFTVVNGVLLRPLPFPDPARLFLISYGPREGPFGARFGLADYHYLEFRRQDQLFEHVASFGHSDRRWRPGPCASGDRHAGFFPRAPCLSCRRQDVPGGRRPTGP